MKYDLKVPFRYAKKGQEEEAIFIEVSAPSGKTRNDVAIIDQELGKALKNLSKDSIQSQSSSNEQTEIDDVQIITLMNCYGSDMNLCYDSLEKILVRSARVDGDIPLTSYLIENIDYQDIKGLLGNYVKFFLSSSLQA